MGDVTKTVSYNLTEIETACNEILELLLQPSCQKPQVVTEIEIILKAVQTLREISDKV